MVDQGQKGYCVPATVERVLRYYGINDLNMHQLAEAGKTGKPLTEEATTTQGVEKIVS